MTPISAGAVRLQQMVGETSESGSSFPSLNNFQLALIVAVPLLMLVCVLIWNKINE